MSMNIHITPHAFNRASQRLLERWMEDHPDRCVGLFTWMYRQLRTVVDMHEKNGTLRTLRFVSVCDVSFPIKINEQRNSVAILTCHEGVSGNFKKAGSKKRVPSHLLQKRHEDEESQDSGWNVQSRRGDR